MTPEEKLKGLITSRFGSVSSFAATCGVKESSIRNLFNRGMTNVNLSTATIICSTLGLDINEFSSGNIVFSATLENKESPSTDESALGDDLDKKIMLLVSQMDRAQKQLLYELLRTTAEKNRESPASVQAKVDQA